METSTKPTEPSTKEGTKPAEKSTKAAQPVSLAGKTAPKAKKPSTFYKAVNYLLGPTTKVGRFMRATLRLLATIVGLFALGMLATYILLYQPAQKLLAETRSDLTEQITQANNELAEAQTELQTVQDDLGKANRDLTSANANNDDLTERLNTANTHILLLQIMDDANTASLELSRNAPSAARQALSQTDERLTELDQLLDDPDSTLVEALQERLTLTLSEVNRDPDIAAADLQIMIDRLSQAESSLFPESE